MLKNTDAFRRPNIFIGIVLASLPSLLGALVLAGWYLQNETLVQVSPNFVPMQYNTALGFFLAGIGVLAAMAAHRGGTFGVGFSVLLIGGLTLTQYVLGAELGVDQLFMDHYITTATSHPGRMAPNTALCFSLTGAAIVFSGLPGAGRRVPMLVSCLGALTFGLGFISFAGYVMELEPAYGWGRLTRMAVHTAAGFMLLGGALTSLAWKRENLQKVGLPRWLPLTVGIGVLTVAVSHWQALNADDAIGNAQFLVLGFGISLSIALAVMVSLLEASRLRAQRLVEEVAIREKAQYQLERARADLETRIDQRTAQLLFVLDTVPVGVYQVDLQGRILFLNDLAIQMYDLPADIAKEGAFLADAIRFNVERGVYGEGDPETLTRNIVASIRNPEGSDYVRELSSGRTLAIRSRPTPDGGIVGTAMDISELKGSQDTLRDVLENVGQAVGSFGADGQLLAWNQRYKTFLGFEDGILESGPTIYELAAYRARHGAFGDEGADERARSRAAVLMNGEEVREEMVIPDGRIFDSISVPTSDGGIVITYTDISDRKRAEHEIEEKEEQLRLALDHMPGAILIVDRNLDVALVNERYREFYGDNDGLVQPGVPVRDIFKSEIDLGLLGGDGSPEEILEERLKSLSESETFSFEDQTIDGRTIQVVRRPAPGGYSVSVATDISEQLKSQRSANLLREALDSFPDMVILYDQNERVIFTNDKYHEIYPRAPSKSEIASYSMEQLLRRSLEAGQIDHPLAADDPEAWLTMALGSRRNPKTNTGETTHKNGRTYFFRHTRTTEGGMLLVQFDITERKKLETETRQNREMLDVMFTVMPVPILVRGVESLAYLKVNKAAAELFGLSEEELLALDPMDMWPDLNEREKFIQSIDEDGYSSGVEVRVKYFPTNKSKTVYATTAPIVFDGVPALLMAGHDVTERKKMEAAIAEKEAQLSYAINNMPNGIVLLDRNMTIRLFNEKYVELFELPEGILQVGGSLKSMIEHRAHRGDYGPGDPVQLTLERVGGYSGSSGLQIMENVLPSGRVLEVVRTPLQDGSMIGICTDITERKQAEIDLLSAKEAAEAATQAKATFLATMSHEIRTPMNGVMSMANLIDQTRLTTEQKELTRTIRQSSEALVTIINDILDVSKIEAGMLTIENISFSLIEQIDGIMDLMAPRAEAASLLLTLHIDNQLPLHSIGDPTRIRQALLNLLGNAVKFTEQGGIRLIVKVLDEETSDQTRRIRFEVVDSGIGMTPEQVGNLFQAFSQAESSTSRRFGGTGLGLAISKNLVELMGGEIGVQSEPGKGSTFWFEIPFGRTGDGDLSPEVDLSPAKMVLVDFPTPEEESLKTLLALAGIAAVECISNDQPAEGRDLSDPDLVLFSGRPGTPTLRARAEELAGIWKSPDSFGLIVAPQLALSAIQVESGLLPGIDLLGAITTPPRASRLWEYIGVSLGLVSRDSLDQISEAEAVYEPPSREVAIENGCFVLVAEDNETNRFVIERVLTRLGIAHEIGNDGALALEMFRNTDYGLLLSDFHMPNMDGFELTKAIRAEETTTDRPRLPIVALTADVLPETARLCEEAGMDGYLRKPIELDRFEEIIKAFVPKAYELRRRVEQVDDDEAGEADGPARTPLDLVKGVDPDIFDPSQLNDAFGSFDEDAASFVLGFLDTVQSEIASINEAFERDDHKQARHRVHAMKGASSSTGALRLGRLMGDIQDALDDDDPETADIYRDGLAETLDELMSALEPLRPIG